MALRGVRKVTRRQEILSLLPATFPQLLEQTGVGRSNLSRLLADAVTDGAMHRVGKRRQYTYFAGPQPLPGRMVSSVFDLGARL